MISVFHKEGLEPILRYLSEQGVQLYSTGGTQRHIEELGLQVEAVEDLTSYPSILGGRVKTLHPKVFGGILSRRSEAGDAEQLATYDIPELDLIIVDLYPFEETLKQTQDESSIIEKIDIGGISLIRAAAKNYRDVLVCASRDQYPDLLSILEEKEASSSIDDRRRFAKNAFAISSHYDTAIHNWFIDSDQALNGESKESMSFSISAGPSRSLRYGENPHQAAQYYGRLEDLLEQVHGKALSYNNLVDIDAAVELMGDFLEADPSFAIIKHTNACGLATRSTLSEAYAAALAADPVSAFGGILISNRPIDLNTAELIHSLFCEVLIAPSYDDDALELLKSKKNRIILIQRGFDLGKDRHRSLLGGVVVQDRDSSVETAADLKTATERSPSEEEIRDLLFANKAAKHLKSNTIVLAKGAQVIGIGTGQCSRVDALRQAIDKARRFEFDLEGAVMASDAFFPFPDCVEIAFEAGIQAVIQPGGSIRDQDSIDFCNANNMAMVLTGVRHFKH